MPEMHTLLTDLAFGESPRWHDGRLWFADWGAQEILAVTLEGKSEVIVKVSFPSFPLCFDWLPTGQFLLVSSRDGLVLRMESGGELVSHADLSSLSKKGLPWNEIVIDGRGNAYINNQGYDFPGGSFAPGTIALLTPDGTTSLVADGIAFPNGMAVTPDNSTLIVAESYGNKLTAFDIGASGNLSHRRVWAETGTHCITRNRTRGYDFRPLSSPLCERSPDVLCTLRTDGGHHGSALPSCVLGYDIS